ncbi:hypothetical protein RB25_00710 [Herbaspirillum rubrisubalbicans]|uniref:AraC family transcriptional regulator n=2 Tax=Herbaspirillum rubrisubalbicans TaxID=80842 RepID=A0ABX9C6L5_9BURK|nr:hypothetical protein [Herbaspirillum rubrisubalbicans]MCP1571853.1 type VI secretion system secreted protein VgrG [Herbaspirillum rubrisubalbicans]QJQ00523.1 hypothetical protein C798_09840 [Herbaspirillum rubrisubalbicans Os34]RAM66250.1 hypothetical protein RB24_04535 [Herbaspirillum rubrisubalbicans]RAN50314.1 hypothetical protein RB25_00710 [Herbaspirillum rubrisubalbicans]
MIQAPQGLEKLLSDYHHARILRRIFPTKDVLPSAPLVNQLDASEWRSRDFTLTLEIMAGQARLELGDLLCLPFDMTRDERA